MLAAPLPQARSGSEAAERSPFERPWLVWLIVLAGLAGVASWSDLLAVLRDLRLPDTDDAMRLVEVRDLLAGQSWFDLVQHRHAGAPPMHWSRFVDAPIAGLILLARSFADPVRAEGIASVLWPLLLLTLYAAILYRGVRAAFGWRAAAFAVFAGTQAVFVTSLFFNALQPMWHALAADLVPTAALMGAAFGMMNLISEMGAVLSPAISGVLRDATGDWTAAVFLDAGLILLSFLLLCFVREKQASPASVPR